MIELLAAYRAASVKVGHRLLRVGAAAPDVCVLTAWNPGSQRRENPANRAANRALARALIARGYAPLAACNAPHTAWAEPGFAVFGADVDEVLRLAEAFGQNAIYATIDGVLALVARRNGRPTRLA